MIDYHHYIPAFYYLTERTPLLDHVSVQRRRNLLKKECKIGLAPLIDWSEYVQTDVFLIKISNLWTEGTLLLYYIRLQRRRNLLKKECKVSLALLIGWSEYVQTDTFLIKISNLVGTVLFRLTSPKSL